MKFGDCRYLVATHTLGSPKHELPLLVNFGKARVVRTEGAWIEKDWFDGWTEVEVDPRSGTLSELPMRWDPGRRISLGDTIFAVAHCNAPNEDLRNASPLPATDPVIVPGRVRGADRGMFIRMSIPTGYNLRGMSGAACAVWDDRRRELVLVGIFCGIGSDGNGVVVRALPMSRLGDPSLDISQQQSEPGMGW